MGEIGKTVVSVIAEVASWEVDQVRLDTELEELDINSLDLTEVVMELEDRYDVSVDLNTAEAWTSLKTVGDVIKLVEKLVAEKTGS
jgi:Acyl carrier protein